MSIKGRNCPSTMHHLRPSSDENEIPLLTISDSEQAILEMRFTYASLQDRTFCGFGGGLSPFGPGASRTSAFADPDTDTLLAKQVISRNKPPLSL